jgi:hypothetical protein
MYVSMIESVGREDRPMETHTKSGTVSWPPVEDAEAVREEWIAAVEQVISDAEAWATEQHWFVHRSPKTITEDGIGPYEVPTLLIQAPAGRFILEPRGRYIIGATGDGRFIVGAAGEIEWSIYPSYESVRIVRDDAGWHFSIKRPTLDRPWSKEAFLEIATELAKKA